MYPVGKLELHQSVFEWIGLLHQLRHERNDVFAYLVRTRVPKKRSKAFSTIKKIGTSRHGLCRQPLHTWPSEKRSNVDT